MKRDLFLGLLLALPLPVPVNPIFPLAFLAFAIAAFRMRIDGVRLLVLVALIAVCLASSLFSPYASIISLSRAIVSTLFFVFFLFGAGIEDRTAFARGYIYGVRVIACVILVLFVATGAWRAGPQLFLSASLRAWGGAYLPAWPNYLAFGLGVGLLLGLVVARSWLWSTIVAVAAIATTSRTGLLAVLLAIGWLVIQGLSRPRWRVVLLTAGVGLAVLSAAIVVRLAKEVAVSDVVQQRLLRTNDREGIYELGLGIFEAHPVLGVGHVLFEDISGAVDMTFHSSYFDVLIRHGVLGLLLWFAVLWPTRGSFPRWEWWLLFAYFLIANGFNTLLRHPHYALLYAGLYLVRPRAAGIAEGT